MNVLKKAFDKCQIRSEKVYFALLAFLTFLLVLNAALIQSVIVGVVAAILAFYLLFLSDSQKRITFFAFLFFFSSIFKIPGISTSVFTVLISLYMLVWTVLLFLKNRKTFTKTISELKLILIFFLIMAFQLFLLYIIFKSDGADLRRTISFLIYILFPIVFYFFEKENISFEKLLLVLALGLLVSSLAAVPCFFSEQYGSNLYKFVGLDGIEYSYVSINNYNFRIFRFNGLAFDPNYYSFFVLSVIGMLAVSYLMRKDKKSIILASLLSILVMLTLSKMMIVLISILIIVFVFVLIRTRKSSIAIILIATSLIVIIILLTVGPTIISVITSRFNEGQSLDFESSINSLLTGRFYIWKEFTKMLFENPLILFFGSGIGSAFNTVAFDGYGAHNSLLETLSIMGLMGLILLVLFFKSIYDYCTSKTATGLPPQKKQWRISFPFILLLLVPQTAMLYLGVSSTYGFAFLLLVLFLSINDYKTQSDTRNLIKASVSNG